MMKRIMIALLLTAGGLSLTGLTGAPGNLAWSFLRGPYAGNYDSAGIPRVIDQKAAFPADFYSRVSGALPEGRDVRNTNPDYIASDFAANVYLEKEADVWANFLHEGAGYRNSFGYFAYTADAVPASKWDIREVIVFPNSSFYNAGGGAAGLRTGDSVYLGRFAGGTYIGFVIVADGFDTAKGVKTNHNADLIYYTLGDINSEVTASLKPHTVLLYDQQTRSAVLGMEDILRSSSSCDQDFNDVILTVSSNPVEAITSSLIRPLPQVVDRDKDGVLDSNDDFPDDPARAFLVPYPSGNTWGTLAFEDQWPKQGDYDMNDLVLRYQVTQVEDSQGRVKDLQITAQIQARGASRPSGFGIELTNVPAASLESATMTINSNAAATATPEKGQKHLTWIFFDNGSYYAPSPAGHAFFNTEPGQPAQDGALFTLKMTFGTPPLRTTVGAPPYNPFIFSTANRRVEVHLPDHPPTQLADASLFGSGDDNSLPGSKRYYKTAKNLPWALHIGENWHHPLEQTMITVAYPDFGPWAEAAGKSNLNWYLLPGINPVGIYP